ncbi:DUF4197 domain-containing protein [Paludibacteraceae bacterium OttesenSCG-928-F17]|nr:DUF4197 domain-containing protein [Paludibacteraceae bacterium OttesenSCG-928-F17]
MKRGLFILLVGIVFTACEQVGSYLSNTENIAGLKEALVVGSGKAANLLGAEDGYLKDAAVKILLPEEAQVTFKAIQAISEIPGISSAIGAIGLKADFEDVLITAINRSAEDAAPRAVNIFANAITSMTITDGKAILFSGGDHTAATKYLHEKTYTDLQSAFGEVIDASLSKVEVAGYTASEAWTFFAEQNNQLVGLINKPAVQLAITGANLMGLDVSAINSVKEVNPSLGGYTTGKALDGLFLKVGNEEEKIRTDINARTTGLLQRVFGQLDK